MSDQPKRYDRTARHPYKPKAQRRENVVSFCCTDDFLRQLRAAADEHGVSLSSEIGSRLAASFSQAPVDLRQIVREEIAAALARQAPDHFVGLYREAASQIHGRDSLQA